MLFHVSLSLLPCLTVSKVAIQHAVESVLAVLRGKSGYAAATSAFTVRTPFGHRSGRADGILGWLAYKEQIDTSRRGAVSSQGSGEGVQAGVCEGGGGKAFLSYEKETVLWIEDRTDRAQVVLTRRRFDPKAVGGAVMAVSYRGYTPFRINPDSCGYEDHSRGYEDSHKGKKRGRSWEDVDGSGATQKGDWDVDRGNASLFDDGAFDEDFTGYGGQGGADMASFGLVRVRGSVFASVCRLSGCIRLCWLASIVLIECQSSSHNTQSQASDSFIALYTLGTIPGAHNEVRDMYGCRSARRHHRGRCCSTAEAKAFHRRHQ